MEEPYRWPTQTLLMLATFCGSTSDCRSGASRVDDAQPSCLHLTRTTSTRPLFSYVPSPARSVNGPIKSRCHQTMCLKVLFLPIKSKSLTQRFVCRDSGA